jgi:hydroxymethylbilane synthase
MRPVDSEHDFMTPSDRRNGGSLRIGTRGSPLALAQARMVQQLLGGEAAAGLAIVETSGDRVQDRPLREIGGKALWTRELDRALLDGAIDLAVHSMKDVETQLAQGIALAATLPRADPSDRLVGASSIAAIPVGATVGTSSPRRSAQLLHRRPDVRIVTLRGNVGTRLARVAEGNPAATFLAAAGLDRLGIVAGTSLALEEWLPAVAQGAIGITCRADDAQLRARLVQHDHAATRLAVTTERALLAGLGGSCHTAVAAHAVLRAGRLCLAAELMSPCGRDLLREEGEAEPGEGEALGRAIAERFLSRATPAIRASLGLEA